MLAEVGSELEADGEAERGDEKPEEPAAKEEKRDPDKDADDRQGEIHAGSLAMKGITASARLGEATSKSPAIKDALRPGGLEAAPPSLFLFRHHGVAFGLELRAGQPGRVFLIVCDLVSDFEEEPHVFHRTG